MQTWLDAGQPERFRVRYRVRVRVKCGITAAAAEKNPAS